MWSIYLSTSTSLYEIFKEYICKRWFLCQILKMCSSVSDKNSIAKFISSRTFIPPAIMASERELHIVQNRSAILKLWLPSHLLTQWLHQDKPRPLLGTTACKVSLACFLHVAGDSQSYCKLPSCPPGPSRELSMAVLSLWWFCKSTKANPSSVEDRQIL